MSRPTVPSAEGKRLARIRTTLRRHEIRPAAATPRGRVSVRWLAARAARLQCDTIIFFNQTCTLVADEVIQ